jgi:NAD(P)H-hydrate epimerase
MRLVTAAESAALDRATIDGGHATGPELMERAGAGAVAALRRQLGDPLAWRVVVLCGGGNNGGDGMVIARLLHRAGAAVTALLLADEAAVRDDARGMLAAARAAGVRVEAVPDASALPTALARDERWDLAVDALLGTGARGEPRGAVAAGCRALRALQHGGTRVLAVDLPSGVDADSGDAWEGAARADLTVTFGAPRRGHFLYPGRGLCGTLEVVDIGLVAPGPGPELLVPGALRGRLPERDPRAHKGDAGRVLLVGGAAGMTGALALAGRAAYRAGAGHVRLAAPASVCDLLTVLLPEAMSVACGETHRRTLTTTAQAALVAETVSAGAVGFGPGLSRDPHSATLAREFTRVCAAPLVLDADALHALSPATEQLAACVAGRTAATVVTPHVGEMARLTGLGAAAVERRRIDLAGEMARAWGVCVVLKGAPSVIASPDGRIAVNPSGDPAMATAGMGDVLTGAIATLLAQGLEPHSAACAAVAAHALAGELTAHERGGPGLLASEVADRLPRAMQMLRRG